MSFEQYKSDTTKNLLDIVSNSESNGRSPLDRLKEQFNSDLDKSELVKKTKWAREQAWRNELESLAWIEKEKIVDVIEAYIDDLNVVDNNTGKSCRAVEMFTKYPNFEDAKRALRNNTEDGKKINIAAALLSIHKLLKGKWQLYYEQAQWYAQSICDMLDSKKASTPQTTPQPDKQQKLPTDTDKPTTTPKKQKTETPSIDTSPKPTAETPTQSTTTPTKQPEQKTETQEEREQQLQATQPSTQAKQEQPQVTEQKVESTKEKETTQEKITRPSWKGKTDLVQEAHEDRSDTVHDGIPERITTHTLSLEEQARKQNLIANTDKELGRIIQEYFWSEEVGSNEHETRLAIDFMHSAFDQSAVENLLPNANYEETAAYYKAMINTLREDAWSNWTAKIPKSFTYNNWVVNITHHRWFLGISLRSKQKYEENKAEAYRNSLHDLDNNINYLIGESEEFIYKFDLDKVDVSLPDNTESETTTIGNNDRLLSTETSYYLGLQAELNATNRQINTITNSYSNNLISIKTIKSDINANESKAKNASALIDQFDAQTSIMKLNQDLLNTELHALSDASLINLLSWPETSGVLSQEEISSRMMDIKSNIKTNATNMREFLETNEQDIAAIIKKEKDPTTKQNLSAQLAAIKDSIKEEFVTSQIAQVDALDNVTTKTTELFNKNAEEYLDISKNINKTNSEWLYWDQKKKDLNTNDPRYRSSLRDYETHLESLSQTLDDYQSQLDDLTQSINNIREDDLLKNDLLSQAFIDQLNHNDRLYLQQYQWLGLLRDLATQNERREDLSTKENTATADIEEQKKDNQEKIEAIQEWIDTQRQDIAAKLQDVDRDIEEKNKEIEELLKKAEESNESYDSTAIMKAQKELFELHQTKNNLTDSYNDTYYEDQLNYQRELYDIKLNTDAYLEHTTQNISRIDTQIQATEQEITTKEQQLQALKQQIDEVVNAWEIEGIYKDYVFKEVERLTESMNILVQDLTGESSLYSDSRTKLLENYNNFNKRNANKQSLYANLYELQDKRSIEQAEQTKRQDTQDYESKRLSYVGAHAQHMIMTQKIDHYTKDLNTLQSTIDDLQQTIEENIQKITQKTWEKKQASHEGNAREEMRLTTEIAKLQSLNDNYTAQIQTATNRHERLSKALEEAKKKQEEMKRNVDQKESIMNQAERVWRNNTTAVYEDEDQERYTTQEFDRERMTYVPYDEVETKQQDNNEVPEELKLD